MTSNGPSHTSNRPRTGLAVFSRAPVAGATKTRLIPALGPEGAAALHARMVEHIVEAALGAGFEEVRLWVTPDLDHPWFEALRTRYGVAFAVQPDADLGERMRAALDDTLRRCEQAIVVGSDCPGLTSAALTAAREALIGADAVVGGAEDGGYVLLGVKAAPRTLFRDIVWSTETVLAVTRARMHDLHWQWRELGPFVDIDTPEDLAFLPRDWPEREVGRSWKEE